VWSGCTWERAGGGGVRHDPEGREMTVRRSSPREEESDGSGSECGNDSGSSGGRGGREAGGARRCLGVGGLHAGKGDSENSPRVVADAF
jgi:hypothetical protein